MYERRVIGSRCEKYRAVRIFASIVGYDRLRIVGYGRPAKNVGVNSYNRHLSFQINDLNFDQKGGDFESDERSSGAKSKDTSSESTDLRQG